MAALDFRSIKGAVATEWVHADYVARLERDRDDCERMLAAAEARIAQLERVVGLRRRVHRRRPQRRNRLPF